MHHPAVLGRWADQGVPLAPGHQGALPEAQRSVLGMFVFPNGCVTELGEAKQASARKIWHDAKRVLNIFENASVLHLWRLMLHRQALQASVWTGMTSCSTRPTI